MVELNAHRDQGIAGRSNVQHRTSNNDVARTAQALAPRVAPHVCFFIFSHSKFDVGRSMFDVRLFSVRCSKFLFLMGKSLSLELPDPARP
jgi:hypothetical protein